MKQVTKAERALAEARDEFDEAQYLAGERERKAFAKREARRAARRRDAAVVTHEVDCHAVD